MLKGQTTPRQDITGASSQSPCSAGELPLAAKRFTAFINDIRTTTRQMQMETQTQITQSSSEKRTFTRLPPEHLAADLMRPVAEEIQLHGVFLTREEILHRLAGHYSTGLGDPCSDPCRWATLCSFMGISALHRTADGSVAALSSIAWAFFKNAFAMYAELVTQRPEISNCEALLAMALFTLRTADACVAARLAAVVAQSVHMLGLHKYEHYIHLESGVAERQRAIFWVTYIVNADVAHKYDIPSPLDVEDFDLDFPKHQDSGRLDYRDELAPSQQASFLRQRSVLAVMQLRIHRLLQQVLSRNTKRKRFDMQEDVIAINGELETWKYSPPSNIQPGPQPHGSPLLEMPVAVLHYVYFSCICKVSMAVVLLANPVASQPVPEEQPVIDLDASCSDSILAKDMCAMAARGILDVLFRLESQPFTHVWYVHRGICSAKLDSNRLIQSRQTLCFPLSAVLILLSGMLTHPASVQAQTDARLIHDFTRYLERLRKEGSDVRDLLDGCTKFHSIATCALGVSNTFEQTAEVSEHPLCRSSGDKLTQL